MTRTQPQTIKERLKEYTAMLREIDNQIERLERMEATMTSSSGPNLTGMPRASGNTSDRVAIQVARKIELEETIKKAIEEERKEREAIEIMVQQIKKPDERAVIRLRYFDRAEWPEICKILFGESEDFDVNTDNYMRKTFRIHGTALISLAEVAGESSKGKPIPEQRNTPEKAHSASKRTK